MSIIHVVSVSGGKDSAATLLIAIRRFGLHRVRAIFCDTGNEHEDTYAYLGYLERTTGVKITHLTPSFSPEMKAKRAYIAADVRTRREYFKVPMTHANGMPVYRMISNGKKAEVELRLVWSKSGEPDLVGIPRMKKTGGRRVRWSNKAKRRALAVLFPSGNNFLDMCLWKGRFPSRKAQFCTQHLKRDLAVEYQLGLVDQGHTVVSWQGVRRDESLNRRNAKLFERVGPGLFAYRPIVTWTAAMVFEHCAAEGIDPNPLYLQGMSRVGCMPCINVNKIELRNIALRFPEHVERIAEWEVLVGLASKRGASTFMTDAHDANDRREIFADLNIWSRVAWSKTTRGGKQLDLLSTEEEPAICASSYGLCE